MANYNTGTLTETAAALLAAILGLSGCGGGSSGTPEVVTLYSFTGGSDGLGPGTLIQGRDGNFYGTTLYGGVSHIGGTVYKLTPAGAKTVLYSFTDGADGALPVVLIQGSDGNFYGTTTNGGGTIFKLTPTGAETVLYSFIDETNDGAVPGALIQGSDGNLYGTTTLGGANGAGTIFRLTPTGVETVLYSFGDGTNDGVGPHNLLEGSDGNFYGTTTYGGTDNSGTVFKLTLAGIETILHSFVYTPPQLPLPDGLIQGSDGNLYGITAGSGAAGVGTVFNVTLIGVETDLYSFTGGPDGSSPTSLVQGADGNLYGTTSAGGANGAGTFFQLTPTGVKTALYSFAASLDGGAGSITTLIQGQDGNFYGASFYGGMRSSDGPDQGDGTIFEIIP